MESTVDPFTFARSLYNFTNATFNDSLGQRVGPPARKHTHDCYLFLFIVDTVVVGIMCLLGFLGNVMSFLVLRRDRSTPVASFLLQSLAVADNSLLVFWVIHYSIRYMLRYIYPDKPTLHPLWVYIRVYTFPLMYIAQMQTIWMTVIIALNRFMAVCMPYKAPQLCNIYNVYKEVAVVTIFSVCYNIPRFLEIEITTGTNGTLQATRTALGRNAKYQMVYSDVLYYIFSFVLPLLLLAVINTKVTIAYQAVQRRKRRMTMRREEGDNNITLVMIIVVLVFMLCQAPARIVQLVWSYSYNHCHQYQFYLIHISNILEVLNSSVNFLIYFIFRKRFRDIFWDSFCLRPLVSRSRSSTRMTTTEGLSLVALDKSTKEGSNPNNENNQNKWPNAPNNEKTGPISNQIQAELNHNNLEDDSQTASIHQNNLEAQPLNHVTETKPGSLSQAEADLNQDRVEEDRLDAELLSHC